VGELEVRHQRLNRFPDEPGFEFGDDDFGRFNAERGRELAASQAACEGRAA
jgi:hypothetical protein